MTGKDRLLTTLRFEQPDRPPHFEIMFELEREAFGLSFPARSEWEGCTAARKASMVAGCVEIYERIVERYGWDGLACTGPGATPLGWPPRSAPSGAHHGWRHGGRRRGFRAHVNDVAFNAGTFIAPTLFHELVTRTSSSRCRRVRDRGALPFVHTDGNIMASWMTSSWKSVGAMKGAPR